MSGGEDASFSGFQVFGLRCPAEAATLSFPHALQCVSDNFRASKDAAVEQGENLKFWNPETMGPGWAVRASDFQFFRFSVSRGVRAKSCSVRRLQNRLHLGMFKHELA